MSALSPFPNLHVELTADGALIRFPSADFDEQTTDGLADALYDLAVRQGRPNLTVDLDLVTSLASSTMGKLIVLDKKLRDQGGRLHLCNVNPQVYQVFNVSRLTLLIDVRPKDRPDAPGPGVIRM